MDEALAEETLQACEELLGSVKQQMDHIHWGNSPPHRAASGRTRLTDGSRSSRCNFENSFINHFTNIYELQVVWQPMEQEFIQQYQEFGELIQRCHVGAGIALDLTMEDLLSYFNSITMSNMQGNPSLDVGSSSGILVFSHTSEELSTKHIPKLRIWVPTLNSIPKSLQLVGPGLNLSWGSGIVRSKPQLPFPGDNFATRKQPSKPQISK
ncbi:hypothetical protein DUI87_25143 [Hirundo rustica rustica]|uniref:Uncharacterized protein n=1 Tax=Hirundo rustica rustica TaxID=333673 RepID=A0A3M0JD77_HIRRU|nr:hypothetical protein DUI87_25143 [Hirundo rustica rustica]